MIADMRRRAAFATAQALSDHPATADKVPQLLSASTPYPGIGIEYREQGGDWTRYFGPSSVSRPLEVRSFDPVDGRRGGSVAVN